MKKYIRSVVLICALNGVRVWAEAPCARKINSPEFSGWVPTFNGPTCRRDRGQQECAGSDGAVGWIGYYCNDGPKRHHMEMKQFSLLFPYDCQAAAPVSRHYFYATKVLSKNPCSYYNNP
jgi:hypothetical protein